MNRYVNRTNGERTWNRYNFVKFLDGDSVIVELNKAMSDVIFQTIVNQTLIAGTSILESTLNRFADMFNKMMTSKINISCFEYSDVPDEEVLNFTADVSDHIRYLNLKRFFTIITENNITIGKMKEDDNRFGFLSVNAKWGFECVKEEEDEFI